jgi:hypothetical protein
MLRPHVAARSVQGLLQQKRVAKEFRRGPCGETGKDLVNRSTLFMAAFAAAPLLALSVGAPTASATPPSDTGASVSINGTPKATSTGSTASSTPSSSGQGAPNIAVAVNGSTATSFGGGNRAVAVNRSSSYLTQEANSSGLAVNGGYVNEYASTGSAAKAINDSSATLYFAGGSTATAINDSTASIMTNTTAPTNNTATAINGGCAEVTGGSNRTVRSSSGGPC